MPEDFDDRLDRHDALMAQLVQGQEQMRAFIAQQMVMNARLERRHEDHEETLVQHAATLEYHTQMLDELRSLTRAQEAHNQALYEMHEELRLAFVDLAQRLGRIEGLLERSLGGSSNGREV